MQSDLTIDKNIAKVKNVLIEEQIVDISMYSKKTQIRMTIMHLQLSWSGENMLDNECACLFEREFAKGLLEADKGS